MKKPSRTRKPANGNSSSEVPADKLRWTCALSSFSFKTTDDLKLSHKTIGQRRAVQALELGLEITAGGYNIFVSGPVGTGRTTTVRRLLEHTKARPALLDDKCYVNNFKDPDAPCLLRLKPGTGRAFKAALDEFIEYLAKTIPLQYESDSYQHSRQEIVDGFKERGGVRVREFEKRIAAEGFALMQSAPYAKPELAPIVDKQPVKPESLTALIEEGKLTAARAEEIKTAYRLLSDELSAIFKEVREFEKQAREALIDLDRNVLSPILDERVGDLIEKFEHTCASGTAGCVRAHLESVRAAVLERIDLFRQKPPDRAVGEPVADAYLEFRVNVLVDNADTKTVPVIFETNPTYKNLFGWIDRVWDRTGQWRVDFSRIKAGSLLNADGGFLVLNAIDTVVEPGVWPTLKRTLRNRRLEITAQEPYSMLFGSTSLKPEPVAITLKVIMVGDPEVYSILATHDEDFRKVFKLRADFDWTMDRNREAVSEYTQVIKDLCDKEKLRPFDRSGVIGTIEYGVRLAGRQDKLSTRFNAINELLTEADYWAGKAGARTVGYEHVHQAETARRERARLYEEKLQESIDKGQIYIDVTGTAVGQVNGLAVYDNGEYAFGKPARITAKTGVGAAGIINIERESQLSGPTHDKGIFILAGYLRHKFAQKRPLVLSASICFEQSYGGVDGDSASSTEIYALLSDLSGLPLRQDIAVTGSLNQDGQVQPIGGINQKIEGFFDTCNARGLTGKQGVMMPKTNLVDLMLRRDVVKAVADGKFHVWAIKTIDEGIELLTGKPAGVADKKGCYPKDSVNGRVMARLVELNDLHLSFNKDPVRPARRPALKPKPKPERRV